MCSRPFSPVAWGSGPVLGASSLCPHVWVSMCAALSAWGLQSRGGKGSRHSTPTPATRPNPAPPRY